MNLIKPSFEILNQDLNLEGIYKQIEIAGRTCYKSEDKITKDSSKKFVNNLIKSKHGAMLEHGTVYLKVKWYNLFKISKYFFNKYSVVKNWNFITTNLRVIVENNWEVDLNNLSNLTKYHEKRLSVRFICDRGVSHELVRHRIASFAQESTRFCNYFKDKFRSDISIIHPMGLSEKQIERRNSHFWAVQELYMTEISEGVSPQIARGVLPTALKTEIIVTATSHEWKGIFKLRVPAEAHPQMRELMEPLLIEMKPILFKK